MAKYKPYTGKLKERYDRGIPFYVTTGIYIYLFIDYYGFYLFENLKYNGVVISLFMGMFLLFWITMSYISFWQTTFTDAGEPRFDFKYKVPKTDPNEVKARAERGEKVISIFTKILIHLKDYATLRGEIGLSESRTLEDVEIEEEDKIPSKTDLLNRNAVMNTFDYNYCKKCQRDVPPRAVHCGHCKRGILKFDHHCVITGNGIGFRSRKPFVLMHFYNGIGAWIYFSHFMMGVGAWGFGPQDKAIFAAQYLIPLIILGLVIIMTNFSFISQVIVLTKESTQHENLQDPGARIFDRGSLMENLAQNFGESSNKLTWLVPVTLGDLPGDGHYFKFYYTG